MLGETFVDMDSSLAKGPEVQDGDTLAAKSSPIFKMWCAPARARSVMLTRLIKRLDRILAFIESGQGSIGKVIYILGSV